MTRKDYVALAAAFRAKRPVPTMANHYTRVAYASHCIQWRHDVKAIVDVLAADNPRFDQDKFLLAAGYPLND